MQDVGAKITASGLDEGLRDCSFIIKEVSIDSRDAVRNIVAVIKKEPGAEVALDDRSFQKFSMTERRWITGVYDDITTKTSMHERQKSPPLALTFYD